ncbi:MAG: diguanylate cyclase domain-containing protein [Hydrogeniiclostridium sp.]
MEHGFDTAFYRAVLDRIQSNIYITDPKTDTIVYMNGHMKQTFGLKDAEGRVCWKTLQKGMAGRCPFCKIGRLEGMKKGKLCVWRETNTVTGRIYMNYDSLEEWNGHTYHIQNSVDITDRLQLSMEASIDELTGVLSRNAGKKCLEDVLKQMKENDRFTVALYDINGLKWVNDTYGHLEGDRLLVFVAQTIQKELEKSDFVFRLSGDEFIVVFLHKDMAQAESWMQKILGTLEERRAAGGMAYDVSFSYGLACIYAGENLSVSDVLSIADSQMYIRKRDHHILVGKKRLEQERQHGEKISSFYYNKDSLFEAISESTDDYVFVGNLKTGEFMYSYKMMMDFDLPGQVVADAAAFWAEKIHPEDAMLFLRSNQEIADGRVERHTVAYRAKNAAGEWVHLLCKGRMMRDEKGRPDLFAGIIRNLDRTRNLSGLSEENSVTQRTETEEDTSIYQKHSEYLKDESAVFVDPDEFADLPSGI